MSSRHGAISSVAVCGSLRGFLWGGWDELWGVCGGWGALSLVLAHAQGFFVQCFFSHVLGASVHMSV